MVAGLETVEAVWNEEDVRNLYRLALRREAEAEAIVQEMTAWPSGGRACARPPAVRAQ